MNRIVRFAIIVFVTFCCIVSILFQAQQSNATIQKLAFEPPARVSIDRNINFSRHFRDLGVKGSILIYDSNNNLVLQHNPQRNKTAFPAASTFKILNSLISLETKVITNEIAVLTWDGIQRELPGWNRDLNMREAFKISAVWFYQVLARRVGYERMQQWVTQIKYGNQNIGRKEDIDRFWLNGLLKITPQQQIQFLRRLYNNDLPFSEQSLSIVKDIMINERTPQYTIGGKTGWYGFGSKVTQNIGWYIGYLEKGNKTYFFATNIDIRNEKDPALRMELTRRCFKDMAVL
ncbi:class D beta-lactamase [Chamaesiphon minutus]|uniref:Beta-lactamase n=1 Tax=Chamaesiphon minutus (strain ATCC 27169 / PCC 6605) TaxID=1173020 RepID=K9UEN4_CHAP6|nr:class D beta-lactamase [Chamaesiphon minutus]AFY93587.1 beta-lactamase class D [Chamaesiphon minutus PCC 6605]